MVEITYIEHEGTKHIVEVEPGFTVMEGALNNNVPGILATCGGSCACATCHVYVNKEWLSKVGDRTELEEAMLDLADHVQDNSRLSCQISVSSDLDGLVVTIPKNQQ